MGLSASQARFLQLTARKSNIEYEVQQITYERLQWSQKLQEASKIYQEKTTNKKLVYRYANGTEVFGVDLNYTNYKNYINRQLEGISGGQEQLFLVNADGRIVCGSTEDRDYMMEKNPGKFDADDFVIADGLDDVDNFQRNLQEGVYFFAAYRKTGKPEDSTFTFDFKDWEGLEGGAIREEYDKSDDAAAEATFQTEEAKFQNIDKKLELELNQLESERSAIQTEMDSVKKVLEDNIEKTFQVFS